jgi:hypothetical protein
MLRVSAYGAMGFKIKTPDNWRKTVPQFFKREYMMTAKTFRYAVALITLIILHPLTTWADGPTEQYHVPRGKVIKEILKKTVGILTIRSGKKNGTELKTYKRIPQKVGADQFQNDGKLAVATDTRPVSNFGYQTPDNEHQIENYRYPITAKSGKFVRIVYDSLGKSEAWVNLDEVEKDFEIKALMLKRIKAPSPFYVDIFYFSATGVRKLYSKPSRDPEYSLIREKDHKYSELTIIDQKGEFVKVGASDGDEKSIKPLGWIRIRDDHGALTIWIEDVHLD